MWNASSMAGAALIAFALLTESAQALSEGQVRKAIIEESIASYPGTCPCPYNVARNGSRCGGRSAYSRRGGYAPICYDRDVTADMIAAYNREHP